MRLRFKPKNKRYTILIVPEGTNPVFRFKFRLFHLITVLALTGILISTVLILFAINRDHTNRIGTLEAELSDSSDQLRNTVVDKKQTIDKLLGELLDLTEKSKTIESKMNELEKLETELKTITGTGGKQKANSASISPKSSGNSLSSGGVGGESIPLSEEDVISLVHKTKQSIAASLKEMPDLQQRLENTKESIQEYRKLMRETPTFWPTDSVQITSEFGNRTDPFNGILTFHSGMDIGGTIGDPVYAAADGKVIETSYSDARGNYISIRHPSGLQTNYLHLSKIIAKKGDTVTQGQKIAELGNTGRSTGPHLHIEVEKNGTPVDPRPYLRKPGEEDGQ